MNISEGDADACKVRLLVHASCYFKDTLKKHTILSHASCDAVVAFFDFDCYCRCLIVRLDMCFFVGIRHSKNTVVDRTVAGTVVSSVMHVRLVCIGLS